MLIVVTIPPTDTPIPPTAELSVALESTSPLDTIQPRLHGVWRRVNAEFINVPPPPFYVLGTELEFNEISNQMKERTADYYREGDIEGWDCPFSGAYDVEIVAEYHDVDGPEATGIITFSPLDLLVPWVSSCAYTPPSSAIPEVEGAELITPQPHRLAPVSISQLLPLRRLIHQEHPAWPPPLPVAQTVRPRMAWVALPHV